MTRPPALMPIGGLARLSRLTVKALRLYDTEGLLVPAWVDPDSGYRYYRAEQVPTATTIALLRSLGVPLSAIREVLEAPDDDALAAVLRAERERAARDLAAREQALRSIERLVRSPAAVRYDVTIAPQRARRLVGLTAVARTDQMGPDTVALCVRAAALLEHLRAHGREPVGPIAETYMTDPREVPPAELVTRLAVATARAGAGGRA